MAEGEAVKGSGQRRAGADLELNTWGALGGCGQF